MVDSNGQRNPPSRIAVALLVALVSSAPLHTLAQQARIDTSGLTSQARNDRFIVKYKTSSATSKNAGLIRNALAEAAARTGKINPIGLRHVRRMATGAEVVRADRKLDRIEAETLMRQIAADPDVEYVEVDNLNTVLLTPNDTRYAEQWGYSGTYGIRANQAWDDTSGSGAVVAVLDTGITSHSDLGANILPGYDFITDTVVSSDGDGRDSDASDPGDWVSSNQCGGSHAARGSSWHGTHVAGTIAALSNNAKGVAGVAYGAKVVPVRVLGTCGGYDSDIADAIIWASGGVVSGIPANTNPAEVLNLSFGRDGSCGTTRQSAINSAISRGATVVVSAGNDNSDASGQSPANCNGVITVASITSAGGRSSFSNYGPSIDIAAPGSNILSTLNSGATAPGAEAYALYSGTSMAAPHVAGVVALMQSAASTPRTPAEIESLLKANATAFPFTQSPAIGPGIVNAQNAIEAVTDESALSNGIITRMSSSAQGAEQTFRLRVPVGAKNMQIFTKGPYFQTAEMRVKFGSKPTMTDMDCLSATASSVHQECNFPNPQPGTYFVTIRSVTATSNLDLIGRYDASDVLSNGAPAIDMDGGTVTTYYYSVNVPAGMDNLTIKTTGSDTTDWGQNNVEMFVSYARPPDINTSDCRQHDGPSANRTCVFSNPSGGTYFILVRSYIQFKDIGLTASFN